MHFSHSVSVSKDKTKQKCHNWFLHLLLFSFATLSIGRAVFCLSLHNADQLDKKWTITKAERHLHKAFSFTVHLRTFVFCLLFLAFAPMVVYFAVVALTVGGGYFSFNDHFRLPITIDLMMMIFDYSSSSISVRRFEFYSASNLIIYFLFLLC